ncbi:MAG: efflux RND transporter periplasmic adaptor subunit [Planctomycetota bacterium]|nr:efflux RND transporter periplasmic adaptor subunit [Planctomycetota bacterium]
MKAAIVVVVVLGILGAGVFFLFRGKSAQDAAQPETQTAKVEKGSVRMVVACTGRVVSNLDVEIKCKASGEIIKLPFDVSDVVEKGALLVELDPVNEQRTLKQAEVSLSASQAKLVTAGQNLEIAQRNLKTDEQRALAALQSAEAKAVDARNKADRMKQLLEKKLGSQEEYDTAETSAVQAAVELKNAQIRLEELKTQEAALEVKRQDIKSAEAQVESDDIAVETAETRLKDTKVMAPIAGIVTARNVQIGQIISSGISNVGGGTTVLTLSDLSRIFILASVDESDIGKVLLGLPVSVTADAFPGRHFRGKVERIATRGVSVSNVVTFEVKIEVTGEQKNLLKPEMTANVEIVAAEKEDVLLVPAEALTRKGRDQFVNVMGADGKPVERAVEIGISDGVKTEIVSGLSEGEIVTVRKGGADSRWNAGQRQGGGRRGPMMFH